MKSAFGLLLATLFWVPSATAETPMAAARLLTPAQARAVPVSEGYTASPDGVRLYYRVVGAGDEVVLAPFALYHGTALDRLATGRRIVTYDPRGRGKSDTVPPGKVSRDLLLTDLDAVRRAVGADKVAIIGWSGGGMETFVYALNNPGRVTRLVQLAPVAPRFDPYSAQMTADRQKRTDPAAKAAFEAKAKAGEYAKNSAEECRAAREVTRPALFFDRAKAALVPDECASNNEHLDTIGAYFGALFKSIQGFNLVPSLAKVTIPRLVIHPLQDNIPFEGNKEWVRGQPNARLLTIDQSGHFPLYEQPDETLRAIATFLDGNWPAEARPDG